MLSLFNALVQYFVSKVSRGTCHASGSKRHLITFMNSFCSRLWRPIVLQIEQNAMSVAYRLTLRLNRTVAFAENSCARLQADTDVATGLTASQRSCRT